MDPTATTIGAEILQWISQYGYIALLPLYIVEGPVVGIISGALVSLDILHIVPVFLLYVSGTLISDTVLYVLSRRSERYLRKISLGRWALDRVHNVVGAGGSDWKQKFRDNYFSLMVLTKLTPINLISEFAVLVAGVLQVPARKFYTPILIAQPIWAAGILAVGYYSGDVISNPQRLFTEAGLVLLGALLVFTFYRRYMHRYFKHGVLRRFLDDEAVDR